jgi:hypothetical protein
MKVDFLVEETATGYSAYAKTYPVFTTGDSLDSLKANSLEAINILFEEMGKKPVDSEAINFNPSPSLSPTNK